MQETHQVLKQLLIEKEAAVKRLEKEIESIHVVLGLLGDTERVANGTAPVQGSQATDPGPELSGLLMNALPSQNRIPPVAAPFSASGGGSQSSSAPDVRKAATRNWP